MAGHTNPAWVVDKNGSPVYYPQYAKFRPKTKLTSSQLVISRLLHYHYLHHIIPNAAAPIELR